MKLIRSFLSSSVSVIAIVILSQSAVAKEHFRFPTSSILLHAGPVGSPNDEGSLNGNAGKEPGAGGGNGSGQSGENSSGGEQGPSKYFSLQGTDPFNFDVALPISAIDFKMFGAVHGSSSEDIKYATWRATGLPVGLEMNGSLLVGTPRNVGSYSVTMRVSFGEMSGENVYTINVNGKDIAFKSVDARGEHTCAVETTGDVWCWGSNSSRQLGNVLGGSASQIEVPNWLKTVTNAKMVTVGRRNSCALLVDGTAKCWGYGVYGQNGTGVNNSTGALNVLYLSGATYIESGEEHTCALQKTGKVRCWGINTNGQIGNNSTSDAYTSTEVIGLSSAEAVAVGYTHSCALISGGTVKCWGSNIYGELGNGTQISSKVPVEVANINDARALSLGENFSCAITTSDEVKCWGRVPSKPDYYVPTIISGLDGAIDHISASKNYVCVVMTGGKTKCWGSSVGGSPLTVTKSVPTDVPSLGNVIELKTGPNHSCAITSNGLKCWGNNDKGQVGNGLKNGSNVTIPYEVTLR